MRRPIAALSFTLLAAAAHAQDEAAAAPAPAPAVDPAPAATTPAVDAPPKAPGDEAKAAAADATAEAKVAEDDGFPLHFTASLTQNLGSSTFVIGNVYNPTFFTSMDLSPSLVLGDFAFSIGQSLGLEWTQSDYTSTPNQIEISDTRFSAKYGGLHWEDLNLGVGLSAGYTLPISLQSRQVGSLGGLGTGARVDWTWAAIGLSLGAGANVVYNAVVPQLGGRVVDTKPLQDRSGTVLSAPSCHPRTGEEQWLVCGPGPSTVLRYGGTFSASWTTLADQLTLAAELSIGQGFRNYIGGDDEFTNENAKPGLVPSESTSGTLSVSYTPIEWFTLTGGTSSSQPLWNDGMFYTDATVHADNFRLPRFPFWDFVSPNANMSTIFVDTTFTF